MDLEDLGTIRRIKLEQCVQLCQFENDANQVNRWIHSAEGKAIFTTDRLCMYVLLPEKPGFWEVHGERKFREIKITVFASQ